MACFLGLLLISCGSEVAKEAPYLATGIKIGEVTDSEAIVWVRLTRDSVRVPSGAPAPEVRYLDEATGTWQPVDYFKKQYREDRPDREVKVIFPEGHTVATIDGAVPGTAGEVRIGYRDNDSGTFRFTPWQAADSAADYTSQFRIDGLSPATAYQVRAETRSFSNRQRGHVSTGTFRTAPAPDQLQQVSFAVSTCQEYGDRDAGDAGFRIYPAMEKLNPDFYVNTGDILYYDHSAKSLPLARWKWQQMYGLPTLYEFHSRIPSYFIKDDHDTWMNDCYRGKQTRFMGEFTFEQGVQLFLQQVPMGDKTYRTFRWGKDLQIWLVEGRDFRSPNDIPDGPGKTIWGNEQMQWFEDTFRSSDATFKVLLTPTPVVGPDRPQKKDNHANSGFRYEGNLIKQIMTEQPNSFVICGDRHWQYASKDSQTGLVEFSCGAASDSHAGGWNPEDIYPEHLYLNVTGGFLSVAIRRDGGTPMIRFTHRDVDGNVLNNLEFSAE